jgi:hypothetical protein
MDEGDQAVERRAVTPPPGVQQGGMVIGASRNAGFYTGRQWRPWPRAPWFWPDFHGFDHLSIRSRLQE